MKLYPIQFIFVCLFSIIACQAPQTKEADPPSTENEAAPKDQTVEKSESETDKPEKSPTTSYLLSSFSSSECSNHLETELFSCECYFSENGENKELALFDSNMGDKACVKVKGQLNALYPDWEERDYKKELKELAKATSWMSPQGEEIHYFGKPLSHYKYDDAVEFLTDVLLASGEIKDPIPIQATHSFELVKTIKAQANEAIAKAKFYKEKGGDDPLYIEKMDNRSYDVFVRYRKTTQYEGEANQYEGTITLLRNRGTEILETRSIKGTCGC